MTAAGVTASASIPGPHAARACTCTRTSFMSQDAFVDFQNVWLAYNEALLAQNHFAVEDINLQVRQGEFIAIVGPSGCGKSTFMKLTTGLKMPSKGHILVDGQRVDRPSFRVKPGQMIHVHSKSEKTEPFQVAAAGGNADVLATTPEYLSVQLDKLQATLVRRPKRAEVPVTCEVQLVVEYYAAR